MDRSTRRHAAGLFAAAAATVLVGLAMPLASPASAAIVPNVSVDDPTVVEGDSGSPFLLFHVSYDQASDVTTSLHFRTTATGTATPATDFQSQDITITFLAGAVGPASLAVPVTPDLLGEPDETVDVELYDPSGVNLVKPNGTGTIQDDDITPNVTVDDPTVVEGDSGNPFLLFHVSYDQASKATTSLHFRTTATGTATPAADFQSQDITITFLAGAVGPASLAVPVTPDLLGEPDETVDVELYDPTGVNLVKPNGTGTIQDDDITPNVTVDDPTVVEGTGGSSFLLFHVSYDQASKATTSLRFTTTGTGTATPTTDFQTQNIALTFLAGAVGPASLAVPVTTDSDFEADETVGVLLDNAVGVNLVKATGTGTIQDDDVNPSPPTVGIGDATVTEGDSGTSTLSFPVTLSAPSLQPITVQAATSDGTATTADGDYTATTTPVTFPAGSVGPIDVQVPVTGDTTSEAHETLTVDLSSPDGATLGDASATGTIVNDDAEAAFASATATAPEGDSGTSTVDLQVNLANPLQTDVSIPVSTVAGTATSGSDFEPLPGGSVVTFPAGATTATVTLGIKGDVVDEPDEDFSVVLGGSTPLPLRAIGVAPGGDEEVVTITDDDATPTTTTTTTSTVATTSTTAAATPAGGPSTPGSGPLARTGAALGPVALGGLVALLTGLAFRIAATRRRPRPA